MLEIARLRNLAKDLGVEGYDGHSTTQLIRAIQESRGEEPCFATDKRHDCAEMCEWRRECRSHMAVWRR